MNWFINLIEGVRHLFHDHLVFSTGLLLFAGFFMGKMAEKIRLPAITGYIIAGLLLGESVLRMIPEHMALQLNSVTEIALGLIAITIGAEFEWSRLRRTGKTILIITVFQAVFAFGFVVACMAFTQLSMSYIMILGAIATATAPAATVVIVRELRARGEFVDYLYGVVAIDDALCVVLFSLVFALAAPIIVGTGADAGMLYSLLEAGYEIMASCLLGFGGGFILNLITRRKRKTNEVMIVSLAMIFLVTAFSIALGFSLLIANMTLGAVLVNLSSRNKRIFRIIEPVTPPIFALFFVLAGTELNLSVFAQGTVILYGAIYLISRFAGKYTGTYISAMLTGSSPEIRKYLGFCLFPQAGVAIGLVLFVESSPVLAEVVPEVRAALVLVVNIVLLSIFINELIGPSISKYGITRGAELK